jgi:hypothetical protein
MAAFDRPIAEVSHAIGGAPRRRASSVEEDSTLIGFVRHRAELDFRVQG